MRYMQPASSDASSPMDTYEACPSCDGRGTVIGYAKWEDIYRCATCGLCFLRQAARPNAAKENTWYEHLRDSTAEQVEGLVREMEDAYTRQLSIVESLSRGRSILDVGCGIGVFLAVAKKNGWAVQGVDESEHGAYFAVRNFDIGYAQSLSAIEPASFDVVRISHILEHVWEPREFLSEIKRVLRPEGVLAVIVPNREPLSAMVVNRMRGAVSRYPKLVGHIFPDMHILGFSTASLSTLVTSLGFEPIRARTVSMGNRVYYPMFYDGLLTRIPFRSIPLKTLIWYWLPMFVDTLGNRFHRGQWIAAYYRN